MLDWAALHPVERLELLTTHDLARQEKQKLELLRALLTYYHYATTESRQEALQAEINRVNAAANEQRDRYRSQYAVRPPEPPEPPAPVAPVGVDELPPGPPERYDAPPPRYENGLPPSYDEPPPPYDDESPYDDDNAETRVINGRHRRGRP